MLLGDLGFSISQVVTLCCDSLVALGLEPAKA